MLKQAELKPTQMFAGILQRERAEREREDGLSSRFNPCSLRSRLDFRSILYYSL